MRLTVFIIRRRRSTLWCYSFGRSGDGSQSASGGASLRPVGGAVSARHIRPRPIHPPFHPTHSLEPLRMARSVKMHSCQPRANIQQLSVWHCLPVGAER